MMTTGKGGRPTLGKDGEKRVNTAIGCNEGERIRLSLLERQREELRHIGDGNISAGFRKVMEHYATLVNLYDLLLLAREDLLQIMCDVSEESPGGAVLLYSSIIVLLNALEE